ncbi:MAG: hypothetical protein U0359_31480 [Byssovorax sp.]
MGVGVLVLAIAGCGKTVTDEDCRKIADNLREVWQSESKKAATTDGVSTDKAQNVIRSEGDKLVASFTAECKKELLGQRVDGKEVDCLLQAKTLDQIDKCSRP